MPDNTPRDWSADEAFWDDAWADMAGRLDAAEPRRKGLAWWWLLGGLLLLGAGLGGWWLTSLPTTTSPVVSQGARPQVPGEEQLSDGVKTAEVITPAEAESTTPIALPTPEPTATNSYQRRVAASPERHNNETTPVTPINPTTSPLPATTHSSSATHRVTESLPTRLDDVRFTTETTIHQLRASSQAIACVEGKRRSQLWLSALHTNSPTLAHPGGGGALEYRHNSRARWTFPVSLALRQDRYAIDRIVLPDTTADRVSSPTPVDPSQNADLELRAFTRSRSDVRTTSLALQLSVERSLRGRLSLGAGLTGYYLLSVRGPVLRSDDFLYQDLNGTTSGNNFALSGVGATNSSFNLLGDGSGEDNLNRFGYGIQLYGNYQVTGRLRVSAGWGRGITPIYRSGTRLERGRVRLGVGYRLF